MKYSGKVAANETRKVFDEQTNGLVKAGTYEFGADGKLVPGFTGVKTGDDGVLYYYVDGQIASGLYSGDLVEYEGSIYCVKYSGKVAANETRKIYDVQTNGFVEAGTYEFGADGKLIPAFSGVKAGDDGILYYYVNGQIATGLYAGDLVEYEGSIYCVKYSGKVAANETRKILEELTNGLAEAGTYYFGVDGKLQTQ